MPKHVPPPSDRSFGFTFVGFFAIVAAWQGWVNHIIAAQVFAGLSVVFLALTLLRPSLLNPLNRAWMRFGALLHAVINPVVLGAIYLVVITPVGLGMRLFGRDELRRRLDRAAQSYWIERRPPGPAPDSLPHQF